MSAATTPHARRESARRGLVWCLILGAIYDYVFAALMLVAPDLPERLLGLPQPGEAFYLWIMAVFLTMLGTLYWIASRDPERHAPTIAVAVVGRTAGCAVFVLAALRGTGLEGLYLLAGCDLLFALVTAYFWRGATR